MSGGWAIALSLWSGPAAPPCADAVEGRVVDDVTDEPVVGAVVRLGDASVETDETGHFELQGICPGDHALTVERPDYETVRRDVSVDGDTEVDVHALPREVEHEDHVLVRVSEAPTTETRASTTLEGEALARTRGKTFADALTGISGVTVLRSSAGGLGKPIIRGQVGRRNLILNGGVRHEGQRWGIDHAPEIDPLAAGSITVIKGAGSIRYGPDAVGGVVLVEPPPLPRTAGVAGQAHLIGVSNGRQGIAAARVDGAHRRLPGFAWRTEGNVSRGAARVAPDYALDNTGSLVWNAGATAGYLGDGVEATLSYRRHFQKAGLCTCLVIDSLETFEQVLAEREPPNVEQYDSEYRIERPFQRVTHDLVTARVRTSLGSAGELVGTYAFQDNHRQEFDQVRGGVPGSQLEFDLRTHSGELAFEHAPITLGEGLWLEGTAGGATAYQVNDFESNATLIPDYRQAGGGVFVIERVVSEPFELQWGVRYDGMRRVSTHVENDYVHQTAVGRIDPRDCEDTPEGGGRCSYAFHGTSVSHGVLVHATEALDLRLDLASTARFPNVDELFANGSAPTFPMILVGDASLGVERTWGSSLTLDWGNRWLATETAGYLNYTDDYIQLVPGGTTTTVRGELPLVEFRAVDAVFYGGEQAFTVAPPRWPVSIEGQVSLVRARNALDRSFLTLIPPDRYRLGVTYRWPEVWRLRNGYVSLGGTVVDRQRRFDLESDFAPPPPAYFLLGGAAGVQLPLGEQLLSLGLEGGNLTNARYRQYTSLLRYFADEPGWEIRLRLSLDFIIHGPAGHQHR